MPCRHTLSIYLRITYQHTLSTYPINIFCQLLVTYQYTPGHPTSHPNPSFLTSLLLQSRHTPLNTPSTLFIIDIPSNTPHTFEFPEIDFMICPITCLSVLLRVLLSYDVLIWPYYVLQGYNRCHSPSHSLSCQIKFRNDQ